MTNQDGLTDRGEEGCIVDVGPDGEDRYSAARLAPPFLTGQVLESLEPGQLLGEGESARVLLAPSAFGREWVFKVARPGAESSLIREGRALSLFGGTHAPRLLGVGRLPVVCAAAGLPEGLVLLMERAPGTSLRAALTHPSSAPEELAFFVLMHGAQALQELHAWGMNHGDFKPDNLHVDLGPEGGLWLIDFGLSAREAEWLGGTPRYLPHELLAGKPVPPPFVDAFALAMTIAEIMLPEAWLRGASPEELAHKLPDPFRGLLSPLLVRKPGSFPPLSWLLEEARDLRAISAEELVVDSESVVRREYLATRVAEIDRSAPNCTIQVEGLPGTWLGEVTVRWGALHGEEPNQESFQLSALTDFTPFDRSRFLARLLGPAAAAWHLPPTTDAGLIDALLQIARDQPLRATTYAALREALAPHRGVNSVETPDLAEPDPIGWAIALGSPPVPAALLTRIAEHDSLPPRLRTEAARVARQMGNYALSRRLAGSDPSYASAFEVACVLGLMGRRDEAAHEYTKLVRSPNTATHLKQRARAALARAALDAGRPGEALSSLSEGPLIAATLEVKALCLFAQGDSDEGLEAVMAGMSMAASDEETARLLAVRGMIHHRRAEPELARADFVRARDIAERMGAALEEATYCTGLAAAATDLGFVEEALFESQRAQVLFEALGQTGQASRSLLAPASILAAFGETDELLTVVRRGLFLAEQAGDSACEAYLCLCACDGMEASRQKLAYAQRAARLLSAGSVDDRLRASARLLSAGASPDAQADEWARQATSREARVDWYRARAEALEKVSSHSLTEAARQVGTEIAESLLELSRGGPRILALGPALVAGAHLSLRLGLAELAIRLFSEARAVSYVLLENVSEARRAALEEVGWIQQSLGSNVRDESGHAQLADVESLLRSMSGRKGFRALLDQTLDLLLMWTKVQRGLLLLRAPGGKLVVRAARNLDMRDLGAEQRALSYSMAERALREGRPVVAVDAVNDVSAIHRSVQALNLRSVLAVPLAARGEVLGVAYLDDRVRRGAFGERELSWVGLISTICALAILDERDRLELKRALRRTKRAENRLSGQLTHREAQLEVAERELLRVKGARKLRGDYSDIVGRSHVMMELLDLVDRVAQSDVPALIVGESGTGKELIARALASGGERKDRPFVGENCSAVPESLLESTLFGHQKGAFTGATRNQLGLFEIAHRGTLFLDEIGDMPLAMQTKLLRVLQEGEVRALGSEKTRKVDVRVIVATHKDLKDLVVQGKFREDLYYRLNVVTLRVPPLRERQEDIPGLVEHFLAKYSADQKRTLSQAVLQRLMSFSWPGNVRQLENEMRRMLVLGGDDLTAADLSPEVMSDSAAIPGAQTLREKVDALERRLVVEALEGAHGNRTRAAEALGLSRFGLQKMAQRLNVQLASNVVRKAGRIRDRGLDDPR